MTSSYHRKFKSHPAARDTLAGSQYRWSILDSPQDLIGLEPAWRVLGERAGGPVEQFDWVYACATLGADYVEDLQVLALSREDELAAVVAMDVKRVNGVRRRVMLGVDLLHEPADVLACDATALEKVAAVLAADPRPVSFARLPADSPAVRALRDALAKRALVLVRPRSAYPYIALDETWLEPEQNLNARRRSDLRRAHRRARQRGAVAVEILTPAPAGLDALLDEVFAVEARSWKAEAGTAMACGSIEGIFCRKYAQAACRQGILRVAFLRIDGRAVAAQLAMVHGGGFWLLKIGFDREFASCSPGTLLLRESIAYAAAAGLASYEFLGRAEPWIDMWTRRERASVALRGYPYNLHGAAALGTDLAVEAAGRGKRGLARLAERLRELAKAGVRWLVSRVSRNYIAGDSLADAERIREKLARQGLSATIGYWNAEQQPPRAVADHYLAGLDLLSRDERGTYLSIKLPTLGFAPQLLDAVAAKACKTGRRIHFDALGPEAVDQTRQQIERTLAAFPGVDIGYTLPARWRRSLDDAAWAAEHNLWVRVVKGEWPDPADPHRDMRAGYLELIDKLAGRARHVSVATHDPRLAAEAVAKLRAAGTPCNLELLYGLPRRASIAQARKLGLDVRMYIPYGEAYRPYALSQVRRKPWILWWLARDLLVSLCARRSP
ncbi:MAG: GNAT family N-acetyltransferase [Pseudomonadales bacterium]|nr:GNAT family N-acetyltransferase [Pseudomonadales bacterium]